MADNIPNGEHTVTVTHSTTGKRVLCTLLFVIVLHLVAAVLAFLILFELGYAAVTQRLPHGRVTRFARRVVRYGFDICQYITWNSENLPFPFEELPNGAESADANFAPSR